MRVISGSAGGRRLVAPPGADTRPTSDRVKEALFSSLGPLAADVAVLDLYAGSGALAVEALSRGAGSAVLVEQAPKALEAIRRNLESTGLAPRATVVRADVARYCRAPAAFGAPGPFDLVLIDAPYQQPAAVVFARLEELHGAGALAPGAFVVVERDRRGEDPEPPPWLARERSRTYGDTVLRSFRVRGATAEPGASLPEEDS